MSHAWSVPDVNFTPSQVNAAMGVLDQLSGVELAFLGGSLAVGLGHALSDIDLYVVGDGLPERELTYEHGGVWVHVNPLPAAKVEALVELGTEYRATGLDRSQLAVDVKTLNALVRVATGWRVRTAGEWATRLDRLSRDTIRQILTARNANVFAAYAEDACGALRSGDMFTAATASQLALEAACEATLASAGDLYVGPKFLFRRLARSAVTGPWSDHLWRLSHRELGSEEQVRAAVAERLDAGTRLVSWCAVDGWDSPLDALPAPGGASGDGPRRSGYFAPVRFVDGWALIGLDDGYEVSEQTVRLWRRLDGRPLPALLEHLAEMEPQLSAGVAGALATLATLGAVEGFPPGAPALEDGFVVRNSPAFSCHPKTTTGTPC